MSKRIILLCCLIGFMSTVHAQLTATFSTEQNTICDGIDCDYEGPSILINELMISPTVNDGSLFENGSGRQGEWIELYNPDVCEPVDISCYYLGNNASDGVMYENAGAGFQIPQGTIIPPGGFCLIRGVNAPPVPADKLVQNGGNVVEIVMSGNLVCMEGIRLWFPNAGGWFAFYDANGVPQDAVSWGTQSNIGQTPCVANIGGCNTGVTSLVSYNNIPADRKAKVYNHIVDSWGQSIRRIPDGGPWMINSGAFQPTPGDCNDDCAQLGTSTCDGKATVHPVGGTAPYTFLWNDSQAQTTQTAVDLCTGTYTVQVVDANGLTGSFTVEVEEYVPSVSFNMNEEVCHEGQMIPFVNYSPTASNQQTGVFTGVGVNGDSFDVSLAGVGEHTVVYTFTDENSCTNSAEAYFKVNPSPEAHIGGLEPSYCMSDEGVPVNTSTPGGVLTGPGLINNSFHSHIAGEGTHTLTYTLTNDFGCVDEASVDDVFLDGNNDPINSAFALDVLLSNGTPPVANFNITSGISACLNGEFVLDASSSTGDIDTYEWWITDDPYTQVYASTFGEVTTISPTTATPSSQLIVLWTDGGCISDFHVVEVDVYPSIDATVSSTDESCGDNNGEIQITNPTGGYGTYLYSTDGGTNTSTTPTYSGLSAGTYDVEVVTTLGNGCVYSEQVIIQNTSGETITVGNDATICAGATATLTASGNGTIEWFEGTTSIGTGTSIDVNPTGTTIYNAVLTDGSGCTDAGQVTITVNPQDDATFSYPSNTLCFGGGAVVPTITGVSGGTFSVDNTDLVIDPTTGEIDLDASQEGIYTVTYTTNDNCPNDESVTITVTSSPDASFTYDNTDYCSNEGTILPSFVTGASAGLFTSTTGLVFVNASTGEINLNASDAGVYTITNTIAASGSCPEVSETFEITVNEAPTVTIDNGDIEACIYHDAIELTATPAGGIFSGSGVTNNSFDPQTAGEGTHPITYTYEDAEGCENSATIQIEVDGCVGISTNELNNQVVLYPNPSTDYVDVAVVGNNQVVSIQVISLEGKVMNTRTEAVDAQTTRIDVSSLSTGTYLVQLSTDNGTVTKKVVIQ